MAGALETLTKLAFQAFSRNAHPSDLAKGVSSLRDYLKTVTVDDIPFQRDILKDKSPFDSSKHEAPIGYFPIEEVADVFSMGVFILRAGTRLPLHDHPTMTGFLKVLDGKMRLDSYTACTEPIPDQLMDVLNPWHHVVPVFAQAPRFVGPDDGICELTPTKGNFHQIHSVDGPIAFLDILAPPYNNYEGPRICNYYKALDHPATNCQDVKFLLEVMQPLDFHCELVPSADAEEVIEMQKRKLSKS